MRQGISIQGQAGFRARYGRRAMALALGVWGGASGLAAAESAIDFNRDIRPILSNNCFKCHGPDDAARQAGLRLDSFDGAVTQGQAIVPGDPAASPLLARVTSADANRVMPPPETGKSLTSEDIAKLTAWVEQGAEYEKHWSFVPPERPALPEVNDPLWPRNAIDRFVLARLEAEGLSPSPEADKHTLIRRVYLDLTGIPPTPGEVDAFINDESAVAYEKVVNRLLESPHFGERWARVWLDLARYADTKGYEADRFRTIWRYRDWVIDAFNQDMPFDQFTIEQLAGDMLPDPTTDQLIATAFHRNTMTNDEGGTDNEEFRVTAVVDRVNTTAEVWMGLTMACAQCHTHKYDPITHTEYYEFFAFFNQTEDADAFPVETPVIPTPTPEQQAALDALDERIAYVTAQRDAAAAELTGNQADWERRIVEQGPDTPALGTWHHAGPFGAEFYDDAFDTAFGPETNPALDATYADGGIRWVERPEWTDGEVHQLEGEVVANYLLRVVHAPEPRQVTLSLGSNDGLRVFVNGNEVHTNRTTRSAAPDQDEVTVDLEAGANTILLKVVNSGLGHAFYFKAQFDTMPGEVLAAIKTPDAERTDAQRAEIAAYYRQAAPELRPFRETLARLEAERAALEQTIPTTPILQELPPEQRRKTHVLAAGSFLNPEDEVSPGVPAVLPPMPYDMPRNRLGLARWLTSRDHPLTARVAVNRFWERFFGTGIVETLEDFGIQGELPSHPELLDWLAVEFMDRDWSMKELCRLIVTSATYRQAPGAAPELRERDPYNRLLARGPRFRMEAEMVRDQALAVAGLLSEALHGPSVMPPQPDGVWQVVYSGDQWDTSEGRDRYRRGLYTFWRRTAPYPSMVAFDAPSREVCTARRVRTNTPLQALVTLNDPAYVEAAQALARRMIEAGHEPSAIAAHGFERALARPPREGELAELVALYERALEQYRNQPDAAVAMATDPLGPVPPGADPAELAAWTVVGNVVLNLDEFVTKR